MLQFKTEREPAIAVIRMADAEPEGFQPFREIETATQERHKIAVTVKDERFIFDGKGERHTDAVTDIFFQSGRAAKLFATLDNLRKPASFSLRAPTIMTAPELTITTHIFCHCDNGVGVGIIPVQRQWRADEAETIGEETACHIHVGFDNIATINGAISAFDAFGKTGAHGGGEGVPFFAAQEVSEPDIAQIIIIIGGGQRITTLFKFKFDHVPS